MAKLKQTAFKFTPEDLALLDAIREHVGCLYRAEALRSIMRDYARQHGIKPKPSAKRKSR